LNRSPGAILKLRRKRHPMHASSRRDGRLSIDDAPHRLRAMTRLAMATALILALVVVSSASATVRKVRFTSVVSPNDYASLTVNVSPRARCTIKVVYDTTVSHARGLGPKTGGRITWRWKVGSSTHAGRWPVTVDCRKSGVLRLRLRVLTN
jgi:hypothetical protein